MDAREELEALRRMAELEAKAGGKATPAPAAEPSFGQVLKQTAANLAGGAVRGAGSIGATLLAPVDVASDLIAGKGLTLDSNRERRAKMDQGLQELIGADPESLVYKGAKFGTEVAGTLGAGGALAKGAEALQAPQAIVNALRSGGMSAGASTPVRDMATRVAGGAVTGGTMAGMVNPEDAGTGALIGGALPLALQVAKGGVAAGRNIVGGTSGVGDKALQTAYESGKAGGAQAQAFRDNMRGKADMMQVLDDARVNLETMRQARSAAYRNNMAAVQADKTVLDLAPIENAVQSSIDRFTFKGQARNPQVLKTLQGVTDEIEAWKRLDPANFHTPEGLDALKQRIGAIRQDIPFEARDVRAAVDGVYNSIKRQIETQAPSYSKAMKDYTQASELLDEITRSLSIGERSTADTAMRKLQSVMRNNVNTNYGARAGSIQALEEQGGRQLVPALAGQALNDWMPRGIQRATGAGFSVGAGALGGLPAAAGAAAISSPRLMGEAAYLAGRADPIIEALRRGLYRTAPVIAAQ